MELPKQVPEDKASSSNPLLEVISSGLLERYLSKVEQSKASRANLKNT